MAELGLKAVEVQTEVDNIRNLVNKVDEDTRTLIDVAKKISSIGIQGVEWYEGTFSSMLQELENSKVSEAIAEIKLQAEKLVSISEKSVGFSEKQG